MLNKLLTRLKLMGGQKYVYIRLWQCYNNSRQWLPAFISVRIAPVCIVFLFVFENVFKIIARKFSKIEINQTMSWYTNKTCSLLIKTQSATRT